jgi:Cu+-exporting ATPase
VLPVRAEEVAREEVAGCAHCGDPCAETAVADDDGHRFCCLGCRTVYGLLQASGLGRYYRLEKAPGVRVAVPAVASRFAYLDDPAVAHRLLSFRGEEVSRISLQVPAIHCVACVWLLENLFTLDPGIGESTVDFPRKRLTVRFDHRRTPLSKLVTLLAGLGYEPALQLDDLEPRRAPRAERGLVVKLGIAGFAAGNVMLLTFPSYLGLQPGDEVVVRRFPWLALALALPVLLYSASGYWRAAARGLRHRRLTMDVPICLGLSALFGSSLAEILRGGGPGYLDSLCVLVFLLLCGRWLQARTYAGLSFERDYRSYFPLAACRLDARGEERTVALTALAPGDRVVLRHGELLPADGVLVAGPAALDYSFVTGESQPVARSVGERLWAGARQVGGRIVVELTARASESRLTELWNDEAFHRGQEGRLASFNDRVSRWFTPLVVLVALTAGLYWQLHRPELAVRAFVSVLIVACPCALALAAPFALNTAWRALGRRGLYARAGEVVDALASVETIVFDKTGTLSCAEVGSLDWVGAPLAPADKGVVAAVAAGSRHPLSRALHRALEPVAPSDELVAFEEEPGLGVRGHVAGRRVAIGSLAWLARCGVAVPVPSPEAVVHVAIDEAYAGALHAGSRWRDDADRMLADLGRGYQLAVASGDGERDRAALARLLGPQVPLVFHQTPQEKLELVRRLGVRRPVMMVGDGLNDAGALEASRVGIAVTDDVAAFSPACDAVLDARSLAELPAFLRFARRVMHVVNASLVLSLAYNGFGIALAARGAFSPLVSAILMPLSSITVVGFAVLATRQAARSTLRPAATTGAARFAAEAAR